MALAQSFSKFDQLHGQLEELFASLETATSIVANPASISPPKARSRLAYITPLWQRCRDLHSQLLLEADEKLKCQHPYFTEKVFSSKELHLLDCLDILEERRAMDTSTSDPLSTAAANRTGSVDSGRHLTQVPKISLPHFSGSYEEWPPFSDYFTSLFIVDRSFDDLQRMHYLKSCLDGEAAQTINHLSTTATNFDVAWTLLKGRYENKRKLIWTHIHDLFSVHAVSQESAEELRRLCDTIQSAVRSLYNLNRPINECGDFLIYLAVSKLDKTTRKAWELHLGDNDDFPTFEMLETFLISRIRALESMHDKSTATNHASKMQSSASSKSFNSRSHHSSASSSKCPVCGKSGHKIHKCNEFSKGSVDKRFGSVKRLGLCINCLASGHTYTQCKSERSCRHCGSRHHSLLHREVASSLTSDPQSPASQRAPASAGISTVEPSLSSAGSPRATSLMSVDFRAHHVVLATAWVCVAGKLQRTAKVRALLDQGSTHTFITKELVRALNLETYVANASLSGIGDTAAGKVSRVAPITVSPAHANGPVLSTDALVLPSLTSYIPKFKFPVDHWPHLMGLSLADPEPMSDASIHMIIGADLYAYALRDGIRRGVAGQPVAQNTIFGWVISGNTSVSPATGLSVFSHFSEARDSLETSIKKFWEIEEEFGRSASADDIACEEHFQSTHSRNADGRYVVRLPFRTAHPLPIGESRRRADRLLMSLERRLLHDPKMRALYSECLRDYLLRGHMIPVEDGNDPENQRVYLSHHPVVKMTSATTKLRVVFNASAPTTNKKSLNDLQLVGPKLQVDLPLLIARWRSYKYVCCADIEQMYRQILVHEADCDYQCIRWRESPEREIQSFQLRTVTFGTSSAPYLAQRVLLQLAEDEGEPYPLAAPILRANFYIDDCLFGADDPVLARQIISQLTELLSKGGFTLRKWASNYPAVLSDVDPANHGLAIERSLQPDDSLKILGLKWCPLSDSYHPSVQYAEMREITKRSVLSAIARLYDPLGWLGPVVIIAKMFMQRLWSLQCDWDEELSENLTLQWRNYYESLPHLRDISIPRWTGQGPNTVRAELHGFSDASTKAYAAVVFLRAISCSGEVVVTLLVGKTKVAPLRTQSVPRLELCAALLLASTLATISSVPEYSIHSRYCWTDSSVVLSWLSRSASSYETFVANRVSKIQSLTEATRWRYVPSADNPADLSSRGIDPRSLAASHMWWHGPKWLSRDETEWPNESPHVVDTAALEIKAHSMISCRTSSPDLSFLSRFSSWARLCRIIALILRWSPRRVESENVVAMVPSGDEIRRAALRIVALLQSLQFSEEITSLAAKKQLPKNSPLLSLNPVLDEHGLVRIDGRLRHANLPDDSRHPLVLRVHPITRLIVQHAHIRCLHGGVSLTLSTLRDQYWVLQAKKIVRSVISCCVPCARLRVSVGRQIMGPLPAARVIRPERAFLHCGVDYAGPVQVRMAGGRGVRSHAAYIALFVCFAVKAVHIEVVSDYSTQSFLAAFHRFCSRRGIPTCMYSDRGTNFQGASRELRTAFEAAVADPVFRVRLANDHIEWRFNPPSAPHHGGIWESGIKSVKGHLKRLLGSIVPTFEELGTLCARIEACLNSRPLAPLTDGLDSLEVLTPGHFLIQGPLVAVPHPTLLDASVTRLSRWQILQRAVEEFWRRWANDYVRSLQARSKWKLSESPLRVGQIVLLKSDNLPPTKWNLARVIELHPGDDGFTRVATVRTATATYTRPITKLALLPVVHEAIAPDAAGDSGQDAS